MLDTSFFSTYDCESYATFCGPAQLHKDLNTLYGYIVGIQADGHINETEIDLLRSWINSVGTLNTKAPYFKLVDKIKEIISDGIVTHEEVVPSTRLALFNSKFLNSSINSSATGLPLSRFQLWINTLYASLDDDILGRWLDYTLVL